MTSRTWGNRCNPSSAGSRGEVGRGVKGARRAFISTLDAPPDLFIIERRNEAERSTVELRSLAVGFCGCIKGSPDFMKSKGRPSILRQGRGVVGRRSEPLTARTVLKSSCKRERRVASWTAKVDHFFAAQSQDARIAIEQRQPRRSHCRTRHSRRGDFIGPSRPPATSPVRTPPRMPVLARFYGRFSGLKRSGDVG
jgi:hypothetical protein